MTDVGDGEGWKTPTDSVVVDDALGFGLCGGHGGGVHGRSEEAAEERNGGRVWEWMQGKILLTSILMIGNGIGTDFIWNVDRDARL